MSEFIKCLWCNHVFCDRHYPIHKTYHDGLDSQQRKNAGAKITEKDPDYGTPCLVCSTIYNTKEALDKID